MDSAVRGPRGFHSLVHAPCTDPNIESFRAARGAGNGPSPISPLCSPQQVVLGLQKSAQSQTGRPTEIGRSSICFCDLRVNDCQNEKDIFGSLAQEGTRDQREQNTGLNSRETF